MLRRMPLSDRLCFQMNGAELPCGSTLQVQPSDPKYSESKSRYTPQLQQTAAAITKSDPEKIQQEKVQSAVDKEAKDDADSDLDDFFESLA